MTENEKIIYKSGRKNNNAYRFYKFSRKTRRLFFAFVILLIFSIILSVLDYHGIASKNELMNRFGAINGVKPIESDFAVYFLDVGQSDCTIVVCDSEVMVVDCGTINQSNSIRQSLMSLNIETIDYMVITHQHEDHMGAASKIIKSWNIKNFIMPRLLESNNVNNQTYNDLLKTIFRNNEIKKIASQDCDSFMLGSALVELLSPSKHDKELNNMSIVLKITYGNTTFLLQGDAETKIENQLIHSDLDLDVDVLKIGHHGSNTSTSEKYLIATTPLINVISTGYDNTYNHPNDKVLSRIDKTGIDTFVTSLDGDISISSDGQNLIVHTQNSDKCYKYKISN